MKKERGKSFSLSKIGALTLIAFMAVAIQSAFGYEPGNYPGKWYGWWHPTVAPSPLADGPMPQFVNQKVIKSWGYTTGNSFDEIKDLLPGNAFYEVCLKHPEVWGDFRINIDNQLYYSLQ